MLALGPHLLMQAHLAERAVVVAWQRECDLRVNRLFRLRLRVVANVVAHALVPVAIADVLALALAVGLIIGLALLEVCLDLPVTAAHVEPKTTKPWLALKLDVKPNGTEYQRGLWPRLELLLWNPMLKTEMAVTGSQQHHQQRQQH